MFSKRLLIDSLKELKEQAISGVLQEPEYGICKNWKEGLGSRITYDLVGLLSVGWKHHSGFSAYPVPDDESLDLWEGNNLEMRLSLIDHILKRLEESDQDYLDDLCKGY